MGRASSVTTPLGYTTETIYDGLGRVGQVLRPSLNAEATVPLVTNSYDAAGRLSSTASHDESGTAVSERQIIYDLNSRVIGEQVTGVGVSSYAVVLDTLGRLESLTATGPAGTSEWSMDYGDVDDLPEALSWTALGTSGSIANQYLETGQWKKTTVEGRTWDFAFSATGEFLSASSEVASHVRDYDRFKRLDSVRLGQPAIYGTLQELLIIDIAYDGWDRISEVRVSDGTPDPASDSVDSYAYDDASRLVAWRYQEGLSTLRDVSYEHDSAGNIERVIDDGSATTYAYDADNRLVSATEGQTSVTYGNDELGRRTSRSSGGSTTTYDWDATGHLAAVISSDTIVTFSYGATGMRELTVRESGGAVETTEHFWRGAALTAERFSDGTLHEYVYGPGGLPLELVVRAPGQPAERYSYAVDGSGSVIGLVGDDAYSGLVASYRYGPYGEVEETWAASGHEDLAWRNPLRYRAYYYDAATGLYYLPARYYDPDTMRFLSPDPAPPSAGDPLSLNRYAYCVGNPVNLSDPTGEIADIWREHPGGVTVGMKVMTSVAAAKRSGATGWDASYAKHSHQVAARVLTAPGSVRPSYRMGAYIDAAGQTVVGWTKPAGYDSWQVEWLRARGQWHWWSQPGKWDLSRSPLTEGEIAATAASTTCGVIGSSIVSAAPTQAGVGSLSACAAASPAGLVVAFVFFDAACWTSAAGFGVAVGEMAYSDATLGDAVYAGGGLVGSVLGVR